MGFIIRETKETDAYDTAMVHVLSWQSAYRGIIPDDILCNLSVDKQAERFVNDYTEYKKISLYFVAELEGKIIGNLVISKCRDDDKPQAGEIIAIYLLEEHWGKGYGRAMIDYALDVIQYKKYNEVVIWVLEENKRARRFYEKCDFYHDGTKKEISIGKPLTELRYIMTLGY